MVRGVNLLKRLVGRNRTSGTACSVSGWLGGIVAAVLTVSSFSGLPAAADEFDALALYGEARPLNDRWQACAASYARRRLQSQVRPDALARDALRGCRSQENNLRRFFIGKIGRRSAESVVSALRLRYRADLVVAIGAARARD
jgi:hypothetical protein